MRIKMLVAKPGVLRYPDGNMYRSLDTLHKSSESLVGKPVTLFHPKEEEIPDSAIVGVVDSVENCPEGFYAYAEIDDSLKALVAMIRDKHIREVSPGYATTVTRWEGQHNGLVYNRVQDNIRYNHLSLVERGRGGSDCAILTTDSLTLEEVISMSEETSVVEVLDSDNSEVKETEENKEQETENTVETESTEVKQDVEKETVETETKEEEVIQSLDLAKLNKLFNLLGLDEFKDSQDLDSVIKSVVMKKLPSGLQAKVKDSSADYCLEVLDIYQSIPVQDSAPVPVPVVETAKKKVDKYAFVNL